jgi:hypothetical protein
LVGLLEAAPPAPEHPVHTLPLLEADPV